MTRFDTLALSPAMTQNLDALGYTAMTAIQEASLPTVLAGRDVLAQAKTGSGKTAAFGIGIMAGLDTDRYRVQAMVLCPTRELATQVSEELRRIARFQHNLKVVSVTGGAPMRYQEHSLSHQAHVVVGTPGRVLKLLERGSLVLEEVRTVVLDEADRMLDMGFSEQIHQIMAFAPSERQTLCFSATFPDDVRALAKKLLRDPEEIAVEPEHAPNVIVEHFHMLEARDKRDAILTLLGEHQPDSTLIFCNTKDACRDVQESLWDVDVEALSIHGDLEQSARTEILIRFANGSCRVLVATDVAARGLDIQDLGAVINHDLPFEPETYVHRIGRTGRAGASGLAFSLVEEREKPRLEALMAHTGTPARPERRMFDGKRAAPLKAAEMVTLSINGGRKHKIGRGDILGALTRDGGVEGKDVGRIDRMDTLTFVAVKRAMVDRALRVLQANPIKGRRFLARVND